MLSPELIAELIYKRLQVSFGTSTQSHIAGQLKLSQSIISRLMNRSYVISSRDNSVFAALAKYFERSPEEFWHELEKEASVPTEIDYAGRGKISIGMASYAVYTAPFINALQKKSSFPEWLRLGYIHHTPEDEAGRRYADLSSPDWWDASNFVSKIKPNTAEKGSERNPFLNCYTSEHLLDLIDSPANNDMSKRKFQAIFCPEISLEHRREGNDDVFTLNNGVELVKVATICSGYGSLLIVASIEDKKTDGPSPPFTEDEELKGYRIENEAIRINEMSQEKIAENKQDFLNKLTMRDKTPMFFIRGIEGTHSFDKFRELWEIKRTESNKDEYQKWQYLMATRASINYSQDSGDSFSSIAAMLKDRKKLVLVAHPPFIHNSFQRIKQALGDLSDTMYVHQYRYNFSQWLGPQQYNLYLSRNHLTIQNVSRLNELLLQIDQSSTTIIHNDDLPDFFYYDPVIKKADSSTKISLETKFLFNIACQELGFDTQPPISYSTTFLKMLLDNK